MTSNDDSEPSPPESRKSSLWSQDMFFTSTTVEEGETAEEIHERERTIKRSARVARETYKSAGLLDPRKHVWMANWDMVVVVSLLFTAVVTPVEVVFMEENRHITPLWSVCDMLGAPLAWHDWILLSTPLELG